MTKMAIFCLYLQIVKITLLVLKNILHLFHNGFPGNHLAEFLSTTALAAAR